MWLSCKHESFGIAISGDCILSSGTYSCFFQNCRWNESVGLETQDRVGGEPFLVTRTLSWGKFGWKWKEKWIQLVSNWSRASNWKNRRLPYFSTDFRINAVEKELPFQIVRGEKISLLYCHKEHIRILKYCCIFFYHLQLCPLMDSKFFNLETERLVNMQEFWWESNT